MSALKSSVLSTLQKNLSTSIKTFVSEQITNIPHRLYFCGSRHFKNYTIKFIYRMYHGNDEEHIVDIIYNMYSNTTEY